jgi:uncharacterized membrane-anchored protein
VRRHSLDLVSLVAGLLFVALAAGYIISDFSDVDVNPRLVFPLALVLIGAAGLAGSFMAQRRSDRAAATVDSDASAS